MHSTGWEDWVWPLTDAFKGWENSVCGHWQMHSIGWENWRDGGGGGWPLADAFCRVRRLTDAFHRVRRLGVWPLIIFLVLPYGSHTPSSEDLFPFLEDGCCYWAVQWNWFAWVNTRHNHLLKSPEMSQLPLPGWFLSRHCFMLCIKMEVLFNLELQSSTNASTVVFAGNIVERWWRIEKKNVLFFGWSEDHKCKEKKKKEKIGILWHEQQILALPRHSLTVGLQKRL